MGNTGRLQQGMIIQADLREIVFTSDGFDFESSRLVLTGRYVFVDDSGARAVNVYEAGIVAGRARGRARFV